MTALMPARRSVAPFNLLSAEVDGRVVLPGDRDYAALATPWNLAVPSRPVAVVEVASAVGVVDAVRFANAHSLRVDVRATGHGAAPMDGPTLLVHTGRLDEVTVHAAERWVRVGAGVRWQRVLDAAARHGLTGLCGSSPQVGVVGYLTGGGLGVLSRTHGFASDHVRAFEVVTGDGFLRRATATEHADLFWGLRGGKGALGIVTAVEFDLVPLAQIHAGALFFAADDVARVLHAWREWAPTLPAEASTSVAILRLPNTAHTPPPLAGTCTLALRFAWTGDPAEGEALLAPMRAVARPVLGEIGPLPSAAIGVVHADPVGPMPVHESMQLLRELPASAVDALLAVAGPGAPSPLVIVELRLLGGALNAAPAVPSVLRRPAAAFTLMTVGIGVPPVLEGTLAASAATMAATSPWSDGRSLPNFGGAIDARRVNAMYTPAAAARLGRLATTFDPHGVLACADAIRAATGDGAVDPTLARREIVDVWH